MRSQGARRKLSATDVRNLRTLLLVNVFEPEAIGARIKQAREEAGLRQEDLADLLEVSTRTVQNYEAGASKPFKHLNDIAAATRVTTQWLIHGERDRLSREEEVSGLREELGEVRGQLAEVQRLLEERLPAARKGRRQAS